MVDGVSNVHLEGDLMKIYYFKLTVMCVVQCAVSILLDDVSKVPIVNQIIRYHKTIYNIFEYGIYNNSHSVRKYKS